MRWAEPRTLCAIAVLTMASFASDALAQTKQTATNVGGTIQRAAESRAAAKASDRFDETFAKYSKRYFGPGFDWTIFKSQAMAESSMNPEAKSPVGARG